MTRYLLVASRDPFEVNDVLDYYELAAALAQEGAATLFLVQNGALPARPSAYSARLTQLAAAGVRVLADEFSLRERGIRADRIVAGVAPAPLDVVIEHLAAGAKVLWD
jgi:intracellular sulfur oxidation DsrE/DsrF family protein